MLSAKSSAGLQSESGRAHASRLSLPQSHCPAETGLSRHLRLRAGIARCMVSASAARGNALRDLHPRHPS